MTRIHEISGLTRLTIISGGQTGVDRGVLDAALDCEAAVGGWCPAGRVAEDGVISDKYPLQEVAGGYRERTLKNVISSEGTVIIYFGELEGGSQLTEYLCIERQKPYKLIDALEVPVFRAVEIIEEFIGRYSITVLNIAGPRASKQPDAYRYSYSVMSEFLQ